MAFEVVVWRMKVAGRDHEPDDIIPLVTFP
jgi:hypothetical protein